MKKALFNIVVYGMLAWTMITAGYMALPIEIQEMLPQMNWITAVISGSSTLLVGSGGLAVQSFLLKARTASDSKYKVVADKYLEVADAYNSLDTKYDNLENKYDGLKESVDRNNLLQEASLQAKLSNPLIDAETKKLIEDVLGGESDVKEG